MKSRGEKNKENAERKNKKKAVNEKRDIAGKF